MTAKTSAPKSKAAPAKARRVAKAAPAPALKQTAVSSVETSAGQAVVTAAEPVAATQVDAPVTAPPAAPAETVALVEAAPAVEPAAVADTKPSARIFPLAAALSKELNMATAFETTQDAVRSTVSKLNTQAETAINNGKAAMEKVAAKSKEAVEASMKNMEELTEISRANVEALIASAKAATAGVEQVMTHLTESSKKSFEDTTAMVKTLASAKTPNELMQLQSDFAKAQFDNAVADYSKLTEMMIKLAGEVMEPVQNQVAVVTDKLKAAFTTK